MTPSNLQCDACLAASFQIGKALYFDLSNRPKMPLYEVYETLEAACDEGHYQNYGIKQVDGVNRISGQGLKAASKAGMLSGGGKWPSRLVDKCSQVVGEVGEEEVFKHYQKVATLPPHLQEMEFATLLCIREEEPRDCATKEIVKQLIATPKNIPEEKTMKVEGILTQEKKESTLKKKRKRKKKKKKKKKKEKKRQKTFREFRKIS